jgi:hypothetical protein
MKSFALSNYFNNLARATSENHRARVSESQRAREPEKRKIRFLSFLAL